MTAKAKQCATVLKCSKVRHSYQIYLSPASYLRVGHPLTIIIWFNKVVVVVNLNKFYAY